MAPSATTIGKIFSSLKFNPRNDESWRILSDVGNPEYYIRKVREELAKQDKRSARPNLESCIRLLVLALADQTHATHKN